MEAPLFTYAATLKVIKGFLLGKQNFTGSKIVSDGNFHV